MAFKVKEGLADDRKASNEQIIHQALRIGLESKAAQAEVPYRVEPHALGLRAGLDPDELSPSLDDNDAWDSSG